MMTSFWEELKGVLKIFKPELKFTFNYHDNKTINNQDQRTINLTGNTITIGDQKITDPKLVDAFYTHLEKYKTQESLPFQTIHQDLIGEFVAYEKISIEQKDSLDKLRDVLPQEEIECIMMARRVFLAQKADNKELFDDLKEQLDKHYPKQGKKVFNLMSTGYFDELVIPYIDVLKAKGGDYKVEYQKFYNDLMRFFPVAIFVSGITTEERLEQEINKRLKYSGIPFIRIHTLSQGNIDKVDRVIKRLNLRDKYNINTNVFNGPFGIACQVLTIQIKK